MKDEILQTSLRQFLKYGIQKMSIQKLVAPLSISTKTVYKYFKNKEELLEEAVKLFFSQQYELLEDNAVNQGAVTLLVDIWSKGIEMESKVNKTFFHELYYYYPELGDRMDAVNGKRFWKQFLYIIQRGIDEGVFRNDINSEVVLEGISILYVSIVRTDQFKKFRISSYDIMLNTIIPCVRGICTAKGTRELDQYIATYDLSEKTRSTKQKAVING